MQPDQPCIYSDLLSFTVTGDWHHGAEQAPSLFKKNLINQLAVGTHSSYVRFPQVEVQYNILTTTLSKQYKNSIINNRRIINSDERKHLNIYIYITLLNRQQGVAKNTYTNGIFVSDVVD